MKHIVYMSTERPVCENPARLGEDWLRGEDGSLEPTCKMCSALVFAYSRQVEKVNDSLIIDANKIAAGHISADPMQGASDFAKGILMGFLIMGLGVLVFLLMWVMFA